MGGLGCCGFVFGMCRFFGNLLMGELDWVVVGEVGELDVGVRFFCICCW